MSVLFPEGVTKLTDCPHLLHDAIVTGLQFLRFEELPPDEQPKRAIYLNPKKLKEHFDAVEKRREEKYDTDSDGNSKEIEDPVENQAPPLIAEE